MNLNLFMVVWDQNVYIRFQKPHQQKSTIHRHSYKFPECNYHWASHKKHPYSYLLTHITIISEFQILHLTRPASERDMLPHRHSCSSALYLLHSCIYILQDSLCSLSIVLDVRNYILIYYKVQQIISSIFYLKISFKLFLELHV